MLRPNSNCKERGLSPALFGNPLRSTAHDNKEYPKASPRLFSKYSVSTTVRRRGVDGNPGVRVDLPRLTHRSERTSGMSASCPLMTQSGHSRCGTFHQPCFACCYCKDMVIPLRLREASKPTCLPCNCKTTPFEFCSVAAFAPPATATPAETAE